jgi:membrane dipeptidase
MRKLNSILLGAFVLGAMVEALAVEPGLKDSSSAAKPVVVGEQAKKIHRECLLIDGHNDLPWQFRKKEDMSFLKYDLRKSIPALHTDIPRLKLGGVGAQFWAAYVPVESQKKGTAVKDTLEQIDVINRMVKSYPDEFEFARTADDIIRIRKSGKIACMIGVEGGHSIDNSLGVLRSFYQLGARYMTLTHSENTDWADSCTDEPKNNGLSRFGEDVVREMNRLGMMVDISHVSPATMRHAIRVSSAPVIASHSSARGIADHPRNVPDDVLRLVKENKGVVMVNFYPGFVSPEGASRWNEVMRVYREYRKKYPVESDFQTALGQWRKQNPAPKANIYQVADHIEHIIKVAGYDHVGIGSDFDGIESVPFQLEDVSCYPKLTQVLLDRGHKEESIRKILGLNLLRVMRDVESVANKK